MAKNNAKTSATPQTHTKPTSPKATGGFSVKTLFRDLLLVIVLIAALSYNLIKDLVVDSGVLLGDIQPFNTEGCKPLEGLEACEDIHIHHASSLAFTTCGNAEARKGWYPPIDKFNSSTENAFQDVFVIYDIPSGKHQVMDLVGFPEGADRVFHGLGIHERSATDLTIFAINHRRTGSVVEVLEYSIGDKAVQYKETIQHELIRTPNDIVALGPREFYVSNDHKYLTGPIRRVEELLRRQWSNVIYYSPEKTFVAFTGVASANGMTSNKDNSLIFLSACHGAGMHVLKPQADHTLSQEEFVKFDFYVDNPSYDPVSGDIFVAGHVQPYKIVLVSPEPGKPIIGPSKVVRMYKNPETSSTAPKYLIETVLADDGHFISTSTVAAIDRKHETMLVGTVFTAQSFFRCPLPKGA